mmetsp:Transcript_2807/g.5556  ORF Transcript_2807/g.5556 Transcript_2807/m.5556 type:complete len:197 (-) Transcript_2807:459-1049(-)
MGLCRNGTDFVHLQTLEQSRPLLGMPVDQEEEIGGALLRLCDNNLEQALNLYQATTIRRDGRPILDQVAELDASQGVSRKRTRVAVDEIALASLESMGVDDATARRGLEKNENDVEQAFLWITNLNNDVVLLECSSSLSLPFSRVLNQAEEHNESEEEETAVSGDTDHSTENTNDQEPSGGTLTTPLGCHVCSSSS